MRFLQAENFIFSRLRLSIKSRQVQTGNGEIDWPFRICHAL